MGTRHLIAVYDRNNELRVAQYGQWDGYPSGQGVDVLAQLPQLRSEQFESLTWAEDDYVEERWKEIGATGEFVSMEVSDLFKTRHPELHRDTGAQILGLVAENPNLKLVNSIDFAADSLFCEWAYVVDFASNTFEVFKGFNTGPALGRFANMSTEGEYRAVTLLASWPLDQLPTQDEFLALEGEDA